MLRVSRPQWVINAVVQAVVQEALGHAGGPLNLEAKEIIAETFFASAHTAYITKSHGRPDEFGDTWDALKPETVRRKTREQSPSVTGGTAFIPEAKRQREWQDRRNQLFSQMVAGGMAPVDARAKANDLAWGSALTQGSVPINVDTGLLPQSLEPGGGKTGQVREFYANVLRLGTSVSYAGYVHRRRPILPPASKAVVWFRRGLARVAERIRDEVEERLR